MIRSALVAFAAAVVFLTSCSTPAAPVRDAPVQVRDDLQSVFRDAGVHGTFALRDGPDGPLTVVDAERAARRIAPESTFKIAHSMVALETGVVTDADHQLLPYGGEHQPFPAWEHDMTLRQAVVASNAAIFVQLARRIGPERETEWLHRLDYGNQTVGDRPDHFWLGGPLTISPIEQTAFLARLANRTLPVSRPVQDTVADILRSPTTPTLHTKTGWGFAASPQVGWWVGWIERPGRPPATFALEMDVRGAADAPLREKLGRELLTKLGVR